MHMTYYMNKRGGKALCFAFLIQVYPLNHISEGVSCCSNVLKNHKFFPRGGQHFSKLSLLREGFRKRVRLKLLAEHPPKPKPKAQVWQFFCKPSITRLLYHMPPNMVYERNIRYGHIENYLEGHVPPNRILFSGTVCPNSLPLFASVLTSMEYFVLTKFSIYML